MFNPLLDNLNDLTEAEIRTKILELQQRMAIVAPTNNAYVFNQLSNVLNSYISFYNNKYQAVKPDTPTNFDIN